MQTYSIQTVADEQLAHAHGEGSGVGAFAFHEADAPVQQTVLALVAGQRIEVNHAPAHATALVVSGTVTMRTAEGVSDGSAGDLFVVSGEPHVLTASDDAVLIVTVSTT